MNPWKNAFWLLLALATLAMGGLGYTLFDSGSALRHMEVGYADTIQDLDVLRRFLPESGGRLGRNDVVTTLSRLNPADAVEATDSTVQIGQLLFMFALRPKASEANFTAISRWPTKVVTYFYHWEDQMDKQSRVAIQLTEAQKAQVRVATGKDAETVELTVEELEERIAPSRQSASPIIGSRVI